MEVIQILMLVFCGFGFAYAIIGAIRNEMTYHFRVKRSNIIHELNVKEGAPYISYICPLTYSEMMWDLRKWSYKAFFPKGY